MFTTSRKASAYTEQLETVNSLQYVRDQRGKLPQITYWCGLQSNCCLCLANGCAHIVILGLGTVLGTRPPSQVDLPASTLSAWVVPRHFSASGPLSSKRLWVYVSMHVRVHASCLLPYKMSDLGSKTADAEAIQQYLPYEFRHSYTNNNTIHIIFN